VVQQPARAAEVAEAMHLAAEVGPRAVVTGVAHRFLQVRVDLHLRSARHDEWLLEGGTCGR